MAVLSHRINRFQYRQPDARPIDFTTIRNPRQTISVSPTCLKDKFYLKRKSGNVVCVHVISLERGGSFSATPRFYIIGKEDASMKHGQLCKIQVHSNQDPAFSLSKGGGWFLKLRDSDGKDTFHLVDDDRNMELSIPASMVDESLRNEAPERPYYIVFIVPEKLQATVTSVSSGMDDLAVLSCVEARTKELTATRNTYYENQKRAEREAETWKESVQRIEHNIAELWQIAHAPEPHFVYAYGMHPGDDREFCWRVPCELYDVVKVGSHISVDTKLGKAKAVVTKIEKSSYLLKHRLVISVD